MSEHKLYTQSIFLEEGGQKCPNCGSDDLDMYDTDHCNDEIRGKVYCMACTGSWRAIYQLVGYEGFRRGNHGY
jgi:hypothetical protein